MSTNPEFESKVPKYQFAGTLDEQKKELTENPLLKRMLAVRSKMADDPHRPIYHYVNPEGLLNDPNGLCRWKDNWHLFYQAYPPEDPRQHWGHAVSDDLIHWKDLPYAIYPNPERCCFSGSALAEDDRVIAMYHGTEVGNMVAVSEDPLLLNWEKVTGEAVIPMHSSDGRPLPYRVFDPCIWKKDDSYYALSGGTIPVGSRGKGRRGNFLFRSDDLEKWEYLHPFVENDVFTLNGDDGACPYFWPIGDKHILLFFSHMSGGQYLIGNYDKAGDKLTASAHGKFNFGAVSPAGVHAPSAAPDGKGGVIVLFNMNPGMPAEGWNQIMTLPRRLTLDRNDNLLIAPAGDVESLRGEHAEIRDLSLPANEEVQLKGIEGNALEINAVIDASDSKMVELKVLKSSGGEEFTRISVYPARGFKKADTPDRECADTIVALDISNSSILPDASSRPPESAPVYIAPDENLDLRVFIDKSVVEVFINGRQCIAARVYPGRQDSTGVSIQSRGKAARIISLDAWHMKTIYS